MTRFSIKISHSFCYTSLFIAIFVLLSSQFLYPANLHWAVMEVKSNVLPSQAPVASEIPDMDILRFSASELQMLMRQGKTNSVQLITQALRLIKTDKFTTMKLNALISVAPEDKLLEQARKLDDERKSGQLRSEFHGIPFLAKDAFMTDESLGMPTSVGSFALLSARTAKNAPIVQKLLDKGMILLGKTNMNEFCNWKGSNVTNGWSPVGGQTISAYVADGLRMDDGPMGHSNPCGSSTGSAVGVAAGYAPLALGTETEGSLVSPAGRAALYSLKCSPGSTVTEGVWLLSNFTDSPGFLAKSVTDLAIATEVLLKPEARANLPNDGFMPSLTKSFKGVSIGYLDPEHWNWPPAVQSPVAEVTQQQRRFYKEALTKMQYHGAKVIGPIKIPHPRDIVTDGTPATKTVILGDYADNIEQYLKHYITSPVRTLEDIIKFNKEHSDQELPPQYPDQDKLIQAAYHRPDQDSYLRAKAFARRVAGTEGAGKVMDEESLDVVVSLLDCPLQGIATAAGYPIATVPLGVADFNGRAFGLVVMAKTGKEDLLFRFMSAFEEHFPARKLPQALLKARGKVDGKL